VITGSPAAVVLDVSGSIDVVVAVVVVVSKITY
jgi:hypothetical protein